MLQHKHYGAELARLYREWRAHGNTARSAIMYARYQLAQRAMLARFSSFTFGDADYGAFAYADYESWSWGDVANASIEDPTEEEVENGLAGAPYIVRVLVGQDEDGVDWGDIDPTDEEREHAESYSVSLLVIDHDGVEISADHIGGIDVIDLPGYLQRDWEDAVACALIEHLELDRALRIATTEARERAYWAARDVVTVEA